MASQIKAIETRYKGYRFRSRLEARWAVFFDALGIKWEYEPEGFELPDGTRYLPDFKTTSPTGIVHWYDVKPLGVTSDPKIEKFKDVLPVQVLGGAPADFLALDAERVHGDERVCPRCGGIGGITVGPILVNGEDCWSFYCYECDMDTPSTSDPEQGLITEVRSWKGSLDVTPKHVVDYLEKVKRAAMAARGARFEFGESGARG